MTDRPNGTTDGLLPPSPSARPTGRLRPGPVSCRAGIHNWPDASRRPGRPRPVCRDTDDSSSDDGGGEEQSAALDVLRARATAARGLKRGLAKLIEAAITPGLGTDYDACTYVSSVGWAG